VISRRDFQPFGEETVTPERTVTLGYQADDIRQKFTSYERDIETDLDFAQTRYYDFGFGRFSSPDSFLNDSTQLDPASWNLYAYVRNNPLNLTDPSGEAILVGKKLDADKRKALLERLNYTYGCSNCVTIDDNGYLQVDTSGLSEEVKKATNYITEAINKPANDFLALVFIKNGSSEVNFAGAGTAKDKSGKVYNAIFLDFDDYKNLKGDEDAKKAFEYTSFAHELAHLYPPPGADDPQPSFAGKERGPVVNAVNEILYATGRILRANYYVDNSAQYQRVVTFGVAKTDDDGKVVKGKDGIEVKADSKKIAWWNSQRIKGIN
jgi:RHS repeat-associated core domain